MLASLEKWKTNNIKTVWFKIERNNSDWIPHLINQGFYFHHAKKNFVTLYHLLDLNYDIPPYAHTNIGVGAFVLNELTNEILVIKEKHSSLPVSRWKLPGGYVEPGLSFKFDAQIASIYIFIFYRRKYYGSS